MDKPQKRKDYLGWTNWETWSCFSHLENNETIYKVLKAHTLRAKNEIILYQSSSESTLILGDKDGFSLKPNDTIYVKENVVSYLFSWLRVTICL